MPWGVLFYFLSYNPKKDLAWSREKGTILGDETCVI